jgi:hypothetical protein
MKFCIAVGQADRHVIEFSFNQLLGQLKISVNNHEVKRNRRLFNEPLLESHTLEVGADERIVVRIEKERKKLFGHKCRVFLNNRLYKCYDGV